MRHVTDTVDFSIAILAGGASRRMGKNKALMDLGGRPAILHVIEALRRLSGDVFIVGGCAADFERFGLPHVADQYDLRASIVGVYSALAAARHKYCLVVSCDLPFANARLAKFLAAAPVDYDATVPVSAKGLEPLFALYSKACLDVIRRQIDIGDLALKNALALLEVHEVDLESTGLDIDPAMAFMNLNTSRQLEEAERVIMRQGTDPRCSAAFERPTLALAGQGRAPLVCIVGKKNSGKTTFLEKLTALLGARGLMVAFIKHDVHGFDMDREGTDTWRLARAGASEVTIASPDAVATVRLVDREPDLDELHAGIRTPVDIVLAEGFKSSAADRIEISRSERSTSLACPEAELVAVISDRADAALTVPVFGLEDVDGVAELLIGRYGLGMADKKESRNK